MDTRFRLFLIGVMALLVVAVWTVPEWWPIVNPDSVTGQVFPGLPREAQEEFLALPAEEREVYFTILEGDAEAEIDPQPEWAQALVQARLLQEDQLAPESDQPFEPPAGAQVIADAEFASVDSVRQAEGTLTIYQLPTQERLLRLEPDFRSTRAPDVHLILTRNPDPLDERGVGFDYIEIGELRGNVGAQTYQLPEAVDFSRYPILALYSPTHDAVLATATLR